MEGLFGEIEAHRDLRAELVAPPFSIIDCFQRDYMRAKKVLRQEIDQLASRADGRSKTLLRSELPSWEDAQKKGYGFAGDASSIFDPLLCKIAYTWWATCAKNGIIDPFAGDCERGYMAGKMGYSYYGLELRPEQCEANRRICANFPQVKYTEGDSNKSLDSIPDRSFGLGFTCPPYFDLEVYSDDPSDLSNMPWDDFVNAYGSILQKTASKIVANGHFVIVIGDIRKDGEVIDLCEVTQQALRGHAKIWNKIVVAKPIGTAPMRSYQFYEYGYAIRRHEYMLDFRVI